jgi:hypothetical protein
MNTTPAKLMFARDGRIFGIGFYEDFLGQYCSDTATGCGFFYPFLCEMVHDLKTAKDRLANWIAFQR